MKLIRKELDIIVTKQSLLKISIQAAENIQLK